MDEALRKNARSAAGGDDEAEARVLRERVRAGEVTDWALRVGASLWHRPCLLAIGLPADHRECLAETFDILCQGALPRTVLDWLVLALRCWSGHDEQRSTPGVAGSMEVRDMLDAVDDLLHGGITSPQRVSYLCERFGFTTVRRKIGHSVAEVVLAWATTPERPFTGSNPAAVGAWLDYGGGLPPDQQPVGGIAFHVRRRLLEDLLPRLLEGSTP